MNKEQKIKLVVLLSCISIGGILAVSSSIVSNIKEENRKQVIEMKSEIKSEVKKELKDDMTEELKKDINEEIDSKVNKKLDSLKKEIKNKITQNEVNALSVSKKEGPNIKNHKIKNLNNFLFIGDSFTVRLTGLIRANTKNAFIHAKSSTMPSYWLDKVSDMPSNNKVDGISLLIGVNGASRPQNLIDTKSLIDKLLVKYPDKNIYVQKVFPVGENFKGASPSRFNKSISTYNEGLKNFCASKERVYFIDTTSGYVNNNGYLINHSGDGLHISESHDDRFYSNIEHEILNK